MMGGPGPGGGSGPIGAEQSGLLFRIENLFCLGSPLSVFLTLRWRDPTNQVGVAISFALNMHMIVHLKKIR